MLAVDHDTHQGTRYRYANGCRCDGCTAANATYKAAYRRRCFAPRPGLMAVTCWCERNIVFIREALVGVTTESCGPGCKAPE